VSKEASKEVSKETQKETREKSKRQGGDAPRLEIRLRLLTDQQQRILKESTPGILM